MSATAALTLAARGGQFERRRSLPLAAAAVVYQDTFLGLVAGTNTVRALVAGDVFVGLAKRNVDNAAGGLSAELVSGMEVKLALAATVPNVLVYASADDTPTLTSGGNSLIGIVTEIIDASNCWVKLYNPEEIAAA